MRNLFAVLLALCLAIPSLAETVTTSTTPLTLQVTVESYVYTGVGAASWTLPAVAGNQGRSFVLANRSAAGAITLNRAGSDSIWKDGATSASVTIAAGTTLTLYDDGTYWTAVNYTGGGGGAPTAATYITQTANGTLSAEQALGSLATGLLKNTTTTGVLSIATNGTDYVAPGTTTSGGITIGGDIATSAGANRQISVDRSTNSDWCRYFLKQAGVEKWAFGMRGDVGLDFILTGLDSDMYPRVLQIVPGTPYTTYWYGASASDADVWYNGSGAAVFNEQGNAQNFRVESDTNANMLCVDGTNNRVGVGLNNPSTTLEVAGTVKATDFTGTVFVRDGTFQAGSNMTPADATTYWGGQGDTVQVSATLRKMYIPTACTLKKFYGWFGSNAGTTEQSTISIRVNNTTDYTVTSTLAIAAATEYSNTSLSIALNAGDYIEVKWVTPTWATNPTSVRGGFSLEFQK